MSTEGKAAYGFRMLRGDSGSPDNFAEFAEITSLTPPSINLDMVETTHGQSPKGIEELIPTILRPGVVTAEINYDPTSATMLAVIQDAFDRARRYYAIEYPTSPVVQWVFEATIQSISPGALTPEGKISATIEWKTLGEPDMGQT